MTVYVDDLPVPELLHVEPDDRPGRVLVAVICPVCWRQHTHAAGADETVLIRVPHCLRRLDQTQQAYTIEVTQ